MRLAQNIAKSLSSVVLPTPCPWIRGGVGLINRVAFAVTVELHDATSARTLDPQWALHYDPARSVLEGAMLRDDLAILKDALHRIDLERLLLLDGGKRVLKKERQPEPEAERLAEGYRADGLRVAILREEGRAGLGTNGPVQDKVPTFTVIASREAATVEEAVEWTRVEVATGGDARLRGRARYRMGRLLGYPDCCLEFYEDLDIRTDEEAVYAAWRGTRGTVRGSILATGLGDYSVLSHAPCSFACESSAVLAERLLDLLRREDEAAWRAATRVSNCLLLYAGERRRFFLEGTRDADGTVRYREVQPAHYLNPTEATDAAWLRALMRGNRLVRSPDAVEVFQDGQRVATLDLGASIRPPILLVPGEVLAHRRLRVALVETTSEGRGDLFGTARASLLAGDLKAAGYRVRAYTLAQQKPSAADEVARVLASERTDVVIFFRVAPRALLDALARTLPHAVRLLVESGEPFDAPPDLERVPLGRLPVLRRLEVLSVGEVGRAAEPALYVPDTEPFYPELQRVVEVPGMLPAKTPREWEVLGRLACPYRRRVRSAPAFAGVNLDDASPLSRGCTMCDFRVGRWRRVGREEWLDSVCRQMEWVRSLNPGVACFRIVDHYALEFISNLLHRFRDLGWTGFTLLLDARVDQVLRRDDWDRIAEAARAVEARLDFTCIGFENFSQRELARFNKGVTVAQNVEAARLVRSLWERYPDVFVRLHAAAGFVTWTPWTTLDDLRENVKYFRELNFSDFRSGLASLRLRLYPDLPLYALAARDGLLLDERPPDWEEPVGYSLDHPWRFASQQTAAAYSLVRRLVRDGEPGRDVDILDLAVRMMERRVHPASAPREPPRDTPVGRTEAFAFASAVLQGDVRSVTFLRAVERVLEILGSGAVRGAGTWCGNLHGFRFGRVVPGPRNAEGVEGIVEVVRAAGRDAALGPLPATHEATLRRLLSAASEVSGEVAIEVDLPAEGLGPAIRVGLFLDACGHERIARVLDALGDAPVEVARAVAGSRLKSLVLEWALAQPLKARVALLAHPRQSAVLNLAATSPVGVRLVTSTDEVRYEMAVGRPDQGSLWMAVRMDLGEALAGLGPSPVTACLARLDRAARGVSGTPVPTAVVLAVSGRHLDPSQGEVRFDLLATKHRASQKRRPRASG